MERSKCAYVFMCEGGGWTVHKSQEEKHASEGAPVHKHCSYFCFSFPSALTPPFTHPYSCKFKLSIAETNLRGKGPTCPEHLLCTGFLGVVVMMTIMMVKVRLSCLISTATLWDSYRNYHQFTNGETQGLAPKGYINCQVLTATRGKARIWTF